MTERPRLKSVSIQGFRPFRDFRADFGPLEVLVGANGSGKSALFEFLRFLRNGLRDEIPQEIVPGPTGRLVFHFPGPERIAWSLEVDLGTSTLVRYRGEVIGPIGRTRVSSEVLEARSVKNQGCDWSWSLARDGEFIWDGPQPPDLPPPPWLAPRPLALILGTTYSALPGINDLNEFVRVWRFYDAGSLARDRIRIPALAEQSPVLREDAANLAALLHFLYLEHRPLFEELQQVMRSAIPGFGELSVKAFGPPGHVTGFWREAGVDTELSLADLSDGTLQLLCWGVLCLHPKPPSLICLDEPDMGLHPRALPILAGLVEEAAERTQIVLATHSSYFLTQFDLARIAVLRKENGEAKFLKPQDSKVLTEILKDFGPDEIEVLHRSDELERLP